MPTLTFTSSIDAPAEMLFAWHAHPGALQRLAPPWTPVHLDRSEGIQDGDEAIIRLGRRPMRLTWIARHHDYIEGRQFCDTQVQGPFRQWTHTHHIEPNGPGASTLIDHIEYALPMGRLSQGLGGAWVRQTLDRQFAYRHRITRHDLALHHRYNPHRRSLRLALTGASGLVGASLCAFLTTGGHEVRRLVRTRPTRDTDIFWNPATREIETTKLEGLNAVIHLAGESVFSLRWTEAKKQRIYDSRVQGTRLLSQALSRLDRPPGAFLCASAIGYYGNPGATALTEAALPGTTGFLTAVTQDWEAAADPARDAGIRTVCLRIGVVLSPQGGALQKMLLPFRWGLGGCIGAPDQYFSWIAPDDVLGAIYHCLLTDLEGAVNLTAPHPVTMDTYTKTLGHVLRRPTFVPFPKSLLRLVAGEVADEIFFADIRVLPERLERTGYTFRFPMLESALRHLLGYTLKTTR